MFELKKFISTLLMPLPALLILGFLGLFFIWFTQRIGFGSFLVFISLFLIALVSFQPLSSLLLMKLERQYMGFLTPSEPINYVMVLGHGHVVDYEIPPTSELSPTALMRLIEGIRIHFMYPTSKLILSGYVGGNEVSHARMLARVAMAMGVHKNNILLLETEKGTWEEVFHAASIVGQSNLVLVTSASHMPRALYEFKNAGLNPIPAPTNYMAQKNIHQPWIKYSLRAQYLEQFERYWHVCLGQIWYLLRDKITQQKVQLQGDSVTSSELTINDSVKKYDNKFLYVLS
ncbi:envelope biogenesis factor ElyC [Candidatus Enterovibrio altilux]|uniref:Membrane Protein Functionally coupled to the MukBEF Chromosome Partitioning Mechanism n=1 Tax=Candidatus Enterovibrio altilux TaxID=1927128 RepID=A0A291BC07_9GAMM|nr:envelope biogenesis factor ElyC [Candidatus Enterovibrio luxaltus]ATF10523.1 Membrane Protein Functionally coupled to the MukBEF Chromosome Partitioning Mechanism [Candidatus Enterovibrio luxaltus]